jgi:hypothetical protein
MKVKHTLPLHKKIEDEFIKTSLVPELEKKKKLLQDLHSNFKPISKNELNRHSYQYEQIRNQLVEQRKIKRNMNYSSNIKKYRHTLVTLFLIYCLGKSTSVKISRRCYSGEFKI